jgi:hypothetical protein
VYDEKKLNLCFNGDKIKKQLFLEIEEEMEKSKKRDR